MGLSLESEDFADSRRTKDEVVTESHQTGCEPVQSHGLGQRQDTNMLEWTDRDRRQAGTDTADPDQQNLI